MRWRPRTWCTSVAKAEATAVASQQPGKHAQVVGVAVGDWMDTSLPVVPPRRDNDLLQYPSNELSTTGTRINYISCASSSRWTKTKADQ